MMNLCEIKIQIPDPVRKILDTLKDAGYEAYIVGGCVRDAILGLEPKDWDITTSALPEQVKSLFSNTVDTGIQHGTVMVILHGTGYEVTTYRIDGEYKDGRHPESVTFTRSLAEDLKRRDFTINAFAYDPEKGIVDMFDGLDDLDRKLIRCVGDPNARFQEDALRIMRAIRFSAQLSFRIETVTLAAIGRYVHNLAQVSMERIRVEFEKTLMSSNPGKVSQYAELGMSAYIIPEQSLAAKCFFPEDTEQYLAASGDPGQVKVLRLAVFLHRLTAEDAKRALRCMKYDNKTITNVSGIIKYQDLTVEEDPVSVKQAMRKMGADLFEDVLAYRELKAPGTSEELRKIRQQVESSNEPYELAQLALNGSDLLNAGFPKGKTIGEILEKLLDEVIRDPECNKKETLLEMALKQRG